MARLPREIRLEIEPGQPQDEASLGRLLARALSTAPESLPPFRLLKRSLDARRGRVRFSLLLEVGQREAPGFEARLPREVSHEHEIVIVGAGPAGLFCAYELARLGIGSTIVDRGKLVQPRRRDLKGLNRHGIVDPDSNYCFGEGGAGTYSDGKLYTRSHKRGNVRDVLEVLALHGAPAAILTESRPHIGSNLLPKVITALRERLESVGVRFLFEARVEGIITEGSLASRRTAGVRLGDGRTLPARAVVLATGHSARDVYVMLDGLGVKLVPKPFALGVRIEHPQALLNEIQYGKYAGMPELPSAAYRIAASVEGRGVFSFCMCPGGFIVPAATEPGGLVVNGMSLSKRNSAYANSGLVVAVEPTDFQAAGFTGALGGVELQRAFETRAFEAGGGMLRAPAARVTDFLAKRASQSLPKSSYIPGVAASDLWEVLGGVGVEVSSRLAQALRVFDRQLKGYVTEEAQLVAVESRTSSPVRVPRDPSTLESPDLRGLYPLAEGAGYAGGIMSAAVDGLSAAGVLAARFRVVPEN